MNKIKAFKLEDTFEHQKEGRQRSQHTAMSNEALRQIEGEASEVKLQTVTSS